MLIGTFPKPLLQIFYEMMFFSKVILKIIIDPDDTHEDFISMNGLYIAGAVVVPVVQPIIMLNANSP